MGWQRAKALFIVSFCFQVFAVTTTSSAATRYVSQWGTSTPPYTSWETAAWFVESANEVTLPGDTIRIAAGDFNVGSPMYLKERVTILGQGQDSTWLYGYEGLLYMFRDPGDSVFIKDIAFDGDSADRIIFASIPTGPPPYPQRSLFFENCFFTRCRFGYIYLVQGRELLVRNCHFSGFGNEAIEISGGGGGYATGTYTIENCVFFSLSFPLAAIEFTEVAGHRIIRNCEFYPTAWTFINDFNSPGSMHIENCAFMTAALGGAAIWCNADSLNLVNNSFYRFDRFTDGLGEFVHIYQPWLKYANISNNVIQTHMDNPAHILQAFIGFFGTNDPIFPETMIKIRNNCIWANRSFGLDKLYFAHSGFIEIDSLSGNIIADPMYVAPPPEIPLNRMVAGDNIFAGQMYFDTDDHDLHLQYGSPCIDAGLPTLLDLDDSQSDMGAYGGPGGENYTYPDLPPKQPAKFEGVTTANSIVLHWLTNTESDLSHYTLFRGTSSGFPLDSGHVVAYVPHDIGSLPGNPETDSMFYAIEDTTVILHTNYFYSLIVTDYGDNVSPVSPELAFIVTDVEDQIDTPLPQQFELMQNYPNPFNAETAIVYSLPNIGAQPAAVKLVIFNSIGQQVRVLVDQAQSPGRQVAYWDGNDDGENAVASGVYFYSLKVSGVELVKSRKMVVVK